MNGELSFSRWVRRRRRALDLTQKDLAARVGCATITIRKIESAERRPSRQIAELLVLHLKAPTHEQADLVAWARGIER
jgi:transcriptional regulator with XRE-family HTH domain